MEETRRVNPEEEAASEIMERVQEVMNSEITGTVDMRDLPKKSRSDQWKLDGLCYLCRRKDYCKTQCRANRDFASAKIREYLRRRMPLPYPEGNQR